MSFQAPWLLLALGVVPLALLAQQLAARRRRRYAARFTGVPTLAAVAGRPSPLRHLPTALFLLALATLAVALARPERTVAVPQEQAAVVLVTDVSGSMRADDVDPTRLEAAKEAGRAFLDEVPDELRVGAVAFSGGPHTVEPPTDDHGRIEDQIDRLEAEGGTATGEGLAAALELLEEGDEQSGDRPRRPSAPKRRPPAAIILLSDGKRTLGRSPIPVAREAKRARVPIYTVSLGTRGGTLQLPGSRGFIPVAPDPQTLQRIARISGGEAYKTADADSLGAVYERLGSQIGTKDEKREMTAGFAVGGIVLLVLAAGLSLRLFGRLP